MRKQIALTLMLLSASTVAAAATKPKPPTQADPAAYLRAFNETCRAKFPDFDGIAAAATALGWQDSSVRFVSGNKATFANFPKAYRRGGMMLFLIRPSVVGPFSAICEITGSAPTTLTGHDVAAIVAPTMGAASPVFEATKTSDAAIWTVAPGISVEAGVALFGKLRTLSFTIRRDAAAAVSSDNPR